MWPAGGGYHARRMSVRMGWRWVERRPRRALVGVFVVSRILFYACGVRFETMWLADFGQFLDPDLLRTRLAESLYYLHAQPPLFNTFLGLTLKLGGGHHAILSAAVFRVLGLAMLLLLLEVMLRCGVRAGLALVLVVLFAINPGTVAMENILFYEYFTAVAVAASVFALHGFVRTSSARWCATFFGCCALLVMLRSTFHPAWLAAVVLAGVVAHRSRRRLIVACGVAALAVPLAWYAKNYALFGQFGTHSWLGMNLGHVTTERIGLRPRAAMIQRGELSPVAAVQSFSPLARYEPFHPPPDVLARERRVAHVPALSRRERSSGAPNFHHVRYVWISERSLRDALAVMRHRPGVYLDAVTQASALYFEPVERWLFAANHNDRHIARYSRAYDAVVLGQLTTSGTARVPVIGRVRPIAWFELIATAAALAYAGAAVLAKVKRPGDRCDWPARLVVLAYCAGTYVYYGLATNLVELGENMRMRYGIQPAMIVMLALAVDAVLERRRKKGRDPTGRNFPVREASLV